MLLTVDEGVAAKVPADDQLANFDIRPCITLNMPRRTARAYDDAEPHFDHQREDVAPDYVVGREPSFDSGCLWVP